MSSSKNLEFEKTAFLSKSNSAFIEEMYLKFVNNDPSLPDSWKTYFNKIGDEADEIVNEINGPSWSPSKKVSIKFTIFVPSQKLILVSALGFVYTCLNM